MTGSPPLAVAPNWSRMASTFVSRRSATSWGSPLPGMSSATAWSWICSKNASRNGFASGTDEKTGDEPKPSGSVTRLLSTP